jgi:hypothetical protein
LIAEIGRPGRTAIDIDKGLRAAELLASDFPDIAVELLRTLLRTVSAGLRTELCQDTPLRHAVPR